MLLVLDGWSFIMQKSLSVKSAHSLDNSNQPSGLGGVEGLRSCCRATVRSLSVQEKGEDIVKIALGEIVKLGMFGGLFVVKGLGPTLVGVVNKKRIPKPSLEDQHGFVWQSSAG